MSRNVSVGEPTEESPYAIADVENALYEIDQQTQVVRTLNLQPPSTALQRLLAMPKCGGIWQYVVSRREWIDVSGRTQFQRRPSRVHVWQYVASRGGRIDVNGRAQVQQRPSRRNGLEAHAAVRPRRSQSWTRCCWLALAAFLCLVGPVGTVISFLLLPSNADENNAMAHSPVSSVVGGGGGPTRVRMVHLSLADNDRRARFVLDKSITWEDFLAGCRQRLQLQAIRRVTDSSGEDILAVEDLMHNDLLVIYTTASRIEGNALSSQASNDLGRTEGIKFVSNPPEPKLLQDFKPMQPSSELIMSPKPTMAVFLTKLNLVKEFAVLMEEGWDDFDYLVECSEQSVEEMLKGFKLKPGHIHKFMTSLAEYKKAKK